MESKFKKSVADVIIERFLKDVDEKGTLPWQRPYEMYNSFNYFSLKPYRGINRLMLPFGEYITKNQIREYNEKHGEDFRFQKGIKWYPVVFYTKREKVISRDEMLDVFPDADFSKDGFLGMDRVWTYYIQGGVPKKSRNVLKFFEVADRVHFKNSKGEVLPSRIESGVVEIVQESPKKILNDYVKASGVKVRTDYGGVPCYAPFSDEVRLNPHVRSENDYFSIAFHEFAHSTGHFTRLNREGIHYPEGVNEVEKGEIYAVEECIAEITASLLCAECGIHSFNTSGSQSYENNLAYVQGWKSRIRDWGSRFIYIVSEADKAFSYILGDNGED